MINAPVVDIADSNKITLYAHAAPSDTCLDYDFLKNFNMDLLDATNTEFSISPHLAFDGVSSMEMTSLGIPGDASV